MAELVKLEKQRLCSKAGREHHPTRRGQGLRHRSSATLLGSGAGDSDMQCQGS